MGGDIGTGALYGAAFGAAGYAVGSIVPGVNFGEGALAGTASHLVNASIHGVITGGAYAAATGENVWEGMLQGAEEGAAGDALNMAVGHAVGFGFSYGKAPKWVGGAFVYDVEPKWFKNLGWITFGNVMNGDASGLYTESKGVYSLTEMFKHEQMHSRQSQVLGPAYLPNHALSILSGSTVNLIENQKWDFHPYGYMENEGYGIGTH